METRIEPKTKKCLYENIYCLEEDACGDGCLHYKPVVLSQVIRELEEVLESEGDLEVEISILKQFPTRKEVSAQMKKLIKEQQYLVSSPKFFVVEGYETKKMLCIRDWAY